LRIGYFLSETVQNLRRNFLMTIAAISTVAISLLLLGGVQILGLMVNNMTQSWEARVEVSVFLRDDITDNERTTLSRDITQMPEVKTVTYITKSDAFNEFKEMFKEQPEFYESLPADALPASYRIKLKDADTTEEVVARLVGAPGVDEVKAGDEFVKRLLQVNALLRTTTLTMSVILMIASAALIANTIRLAIYARREEIGIMKLVGATNWFIRIPFMLEGVFAALVGALISGLIVIGANTFLFSRIGNALAFLRQVFQFSPGEMISVLLLLVGVGLVVGLIGSTLALRRFLEV
jgi:cell division transport system permease protein